MELFDWAALVGVLLPFVISVLKRNNWSTRIKQWLAFGAAVVAAVMTEGVAVNWELSPAGILTAFGVIFPASQAFYHTILADSKTETVLANAFSGSSG